MKDSVLLMHKNDAAGIQLQNKLEEAGYKVRLCFNFEDTAAELINDMPGILLLQVEKEGGELYGEMERLGGYSSFPVLVMLEEWNSEELVTALEAGMIEVVEATIPFVELKARIRSLIRLYGRFTEDYVSELNYEDLKIELKGRKTYRGDELLKLTPKEFDLLKYLVKRAEHVCQRDQILQEVWGYDFATGTNVVDVYIRHLRKKIDKGRPRKLIHTVRGTGYVIQ
ncbi:response regulator transcription factor [Paenibacillus sanfengchensis]|uniref:response regulator transcription factor n=2 Tax=Paenibacillus TaxID=44249 RepID=UPI002FE1C108